MTGIPAYAVAPIHAARPARLRSARPVVKEERLFAALIEEKRIAPLQSRHGLAFARLFSEQVTNGVLIARLGRGAADVDPFGVFRRNRQQVGLTR